MTPRTVSATRYVTPLREGGSMPAIVEADDDGMYVLKFRGAGQGPRALVAELISGEIARALQLPVPEIVLIELDAELARTEGDPEIQDLIKASAGLNLALDYLPGAANFDPVAEQPDPALASDIVWFDAFISNVDRTVRNPNLLIWHRRLTLIDHGASLYFHHGWDGDTGGAGRPFPLIPGSRPAAPGQRSGSRRRAAQRAAVARTAGRHRRTGTGHVAAGWRRLRSARPAACGLYPLSAAAPGAAACVRAGGPACARLTATTTLSSGWCRGWSARNSSTSA